MKKGQMTKAIIYLVLFLTLIFAFVLLFGNTSESILGMDIGCRWTAQLSAAGMPVSLRCPVQYVELNDRMVEDEIRLKNKVAEEMANCFSKFGSGKYESVTRTSPLTWTANPRRSVIVKWDEITGSSNCHICSYVFTKNEEKEMDLGMFYTHLENTVPRGSGLTYAEIMYSEKRDNIHIALEQMKTTEYKATGLFVVYAELDKKNAVFLADQEFLSNSRICGSSTFATSPNVGDTS